MEPSDSSKKGVWINADDFFFLSENLLWTDYF